MEMTDLKLPADLCRRVQRRFLAAESAGNLESFVVAVLEELVEDSAAIDRQEDELLAERLRSLGYLSRD